MRRGLALAALLALPAQALTPDFPAGAVAVVSNQTTERVTFPTGVLAEGEVPRASAEGAVTTRVWRLPGQGREVPLATLVAPLRKVLRAEGYELVTDCAAVECGGFDFRFALPLVPEPDMHVDLAGYHALIGRKGASWAIAVASQSVEAGFVQVTEVSGTATMVAAKGFAPAEPAPPAPAPVAPSGSLAEALLTEGHVMLDEVQFAAGTSALAEGSYARLAELALWLAADPSRKLMLVGHTDADGPLEVNVSVSRKRAAAVRDKLVALGAPESQISAEGAGFLAPVATNQTEAGRQQNRRVEAVLMR